MGWSRYLPQENAPFIRQLSFCLFQWFCEDKTSILYVLSHAVIKPSRHIIKHGPTRFINMQCFTRISRIISTTFTTTPPTTYKQIKRYQSVSHHLPLLMITSYAHFIKVINRNTIRPHIYQTTASSCPNK